MDLRRSFFNMYHAISWMEFQTNVRHSGDMSYRDIMYINLIMFMDNCTVSKLADMLNISKPAVTVRVNQLIEKGIVIKQKSKLDERVNILMISPKVYTTYGDEDRRINHALAKLCEEYPPEDVDRFAEMLNSLSENLVKKDE